MTPSLAPPTPARILGFWLASLLLGAGLVLLRGLSSGRGYPFFEASYSLLYALVFTLPSLLLLCRLLPLALAAPKLRGRQLRALALQCGSLGLTLGLAALLGERMFYAALPLGIWYFLGGLLAAGWRFWPWLRG